MTSANRPLPYADDVETIPADEADDIQRVIDALESILARSQAKSGQFRADVHVKTQGYAEGEFRVLPNLPEELAQGLFEHDGVYSAVVRFSNAASQAQPDAIPDGRGMAIKVLDLEGDVVVVDEERGRTQDFVMINHPVFFARNVKDYLRLEQVLAQADDSSLATLQGALTGGDWNPLHWHWREMLAVARIAGQLPAHPASNTYFSMAPIRFGRYVAKYRAKPAGDRHDSYLDLVKRLGSQADAMRLALEETLRTQEVLFEYQVQLRTSAKRCPSKMPASSSAKANRLTERSRTYYYRARRSNYYGGRRPTRNSHSTFGMHSPRIGPWAASTASAAGPTPSRPRGVVNKPGPSWRSRQAPVKSADNLQRSICLRGHPHFQPRRRGEGASEAEHPRAQMRTTSGPTPGGYLRFAPDGLRLWQWKSCDPLERDFPTEMSDD